MSIFQKIIEPYKNYRLERFNRLEKSLGDVDGCLKASPQSPAKGQADKLKVTLQSMPHQLALAKGIDRSLMAAKASPAKPKKTIDPAELVAFEALARSKGVAAIGYTQVPPEAIFKDRAVLYPFAIVLTMEMDKPAVDSAPSPAAQSMGIETYERLGNITNELVEYLRGKGYAAHAGHPANGVALYPKLAQKAGLGWKGRHGLIITPEFGPRTRLSAIYTGIWNLPLTDSDRHAWIPGFCAKCGNCIRSCPEQAILEKPVEREGGTVTHIVKAKCVGCTVCMKSCSFNKKGYADIKAAFDKRTA
ncbi:MAG TPA: 4Fe-4S dicluster domain-containing protein [Methanocella sp.]|jgi:ferredoxin